MREVYMDHNATTPLHPKVRDIIVQHVDVYGNPSSMHLFGRRAARLIDEARTRIASLINASPDELIFTGGGSESNNTVLKLVTCGGASCPGCSAMRNEIITTSIEHPSVLNTCKALEHQGVKLRYLDVDSQGRIDLDQLKSFLTDQTALVSIMMANNEIGTIQDIKAAVKITKEKSVLFHTDAVQAVGKIPVDVRDLNVDFLSFSGHKLNAPKGIGGLYVKRNAPYCNLIHGGHQEEGRRAGTLNTLGIIALGEAARIAEEEGPGEAARLLELREYIKAGILRSIPDVHFNGHPVHSLPGTLNVSFRGAEGESILLYLDMDGIAVSTGSACASGALDPSHVLMATGVGPELAHGSIRISLGYGSGREDADYLLAKLPPVIERIRKMSSVYGIAG
ncbi:MAG: cysteine desulfurase [Spirochaetales bacterium]|nr:cysteine desulfurase [Spirochaetales bacterium]